MAKIQDVDIPHLEFAEAAAPGTPASGIVRIYAKADGLLYSKDDAGAETLVSGGSGSLTDHNHTAAGGDGGDLDSPVIDGYAVFNEEAAPGTADAATVRLYAKSDGLLYSKDDAGTETLVSGGAGSSGLTPGQAVSYPTSFTGDVIRGDDITTWTDVAAFDTKEALNSRVGRLITLGASKTHRVRKTLGTSKAGAFDIRWCVSPSFMQWGGAFDTYAELRLTDNSSNIIAICRIGAAVAAAVASESPYIFIPRVGASSVISTNAGMQFQQGEAFTLRMMRDGSDNVTFEWGLGTAPLYLAPVKANADYTLYSVSSAGTVTRAEIAIVTPSGPSAGSRAELVLDYLASV